jgi:3-hydroxyisobutyrate dehydrogenase-like beta-hydroxyacid dehydrogenase
LSDSGVIAIIGLGEAGSAIARDLAAAGRPVRGFDPAPHRVPEGVREAAGEGDAADGAEVVLSVNSAAAAVHVAEAVAPSLGAGALFADLNTAAPAVKRAAAEAVAGTGAAFADVALIGPVPGSGIRTPALVSGPGAQTFAATFGPLGMPVTAVGPEVGAASARKLARSVFAKGLAAAIGEALAAAERLGCEDWLFAEIERTLSAADGALLRRLIDGSRLHAARRVEEMGAAVALLEELEVEPRSATAAQAWLRSLARSGVGG